MMQSQESFMSDRSTSASSTTSEILLRKPVCALVSRSGSTSTTLPKVSKAASLPLPQSIVRFRDRMCKSHVQAQGSGSHQLSGSQAARNLRGIHSRPPSPFTPIGGSFSQASRWNY
eukprot:GHVT01100564.1.p2 GENE.GHVT01100564.1~~GHVT01100564.1.p2  ORF type:complete len:116 (-),score=2.05 GHVT01100564.1:469-816(-)